MKRPNWWNVAGWLLLGLSAMLALGFAAIGAWGFSHLSDLHGLDGPE